jgi:hypothetical protein
MQASKNVSFESKKEFFASRSLKDTTNSLKDTFKSAKEDKDEGLDDEFANKSIMMSSIPKREANAEEEYTLLDDSSIF